MLEPSELLPEFIAELRRFAAWEPTSKEDLQRWYDEVAALESGAFAPLVGQMEEFYWHYMSDADIRARDPRYKEIQQEGFLTLIDEFEKRILGTLSEHE